MEAARIEVRKHGNKVSVWATGRTERGQSFIKGTRELKVTSMSDKNFKDEMAQAVKELLGTEE